MTDRNKPFRSALWPPPGDPRAAHKIISETKDCAPDCSCWATRRGQPEPTTLLLVHAPAGPNELVTQDGLTFVASERALCGSAKGWVTGVAFHSVVTCPDCREKTGKVCEVLGKGAHIRLLPALPDGEAP
jgi:hypothetical protein